MKLAFCLFKYYPFGGLERDFLRIAKTCQQRGFEIHVYVMQWQGEIPAGFNIHVITVKAFTNHTRCWKFTQQLQRQLQQHHYDVVIGFNRMPGLDVYFAADPCYQVHALQKHGKWYRYTQRYRTYRALEKAVFSSAAKTEILLLTPLERENFIACYKTQPERFHEITPGVDLDRKLPPNSHDIRIKKRAELALDNQQKLILMVGSDFKRKGVARALLALAALPINVRVNTQLVVLGKGKEKYYLRLAKKLHIITQVKFMGGRHDVLNFLLAADILLHPAYQETAGMILLEALAVGLPILVTANCGYAPYIKQAQAGLLVSTPYQQVELNHKLFTMLTADAERSQWQDNALTFIQKNNFFGLAENVADIIESISLKKHSIT